MTEVAVTALHPASSDQELVVQPPYAEGVAAEERRAPPDEAPKSHRRLPTAKRTRSVPTVIIDKSPLFRKGLEHLLGGSLFRVTTSTGNVAEICAQALGEGPCVMLLSLDQDAPTTIEHLRELKNERQNLRIIALAAGLCPKQLAETIGAGANGYLLKNDISPDALLHSLKLALLDVIVLPRVFRKQLKAWIHPSGDCAPKPNGASTSSTCAEPSLADDSFALRDCAQLSGRQRRILKLLTQGASNKQIAQALDVAEATVKVHLKSLLRKIKVNNRTQAAIWAVDNLKSLLLMAKASALL